MNHFVVRSSLVAGILSGVSACLPIPHRHTRVPATSIEVVDRLGAPVAGATVRLYAVYQVGGGLDTAIAIRTDSVGRAEIAAEKYWHSMLVLVPDGEAGTDAFVCARWLDRLAAADLDERQENVVSLQLALGPTPYACDGTENDAWLIESEFNGR